VKEILSASKLYGIVDLGYTPLEQACQVTEELIKGGIGIIQLRAKTYEVAAIASLAAQMQAICRQHQCIFVLNDHIELAKQLAVDALHVGQDAEDSASIRAYIGPDILLGRSTHSHAQAIEARAQGADYIGFGPLFPTETKPGRPAIGLDDIAPLRQKLGEDFPMFCIGGINEESLPRVLQAGAARVVIVSWLLKQKNIAQKAEEIIQMLEQKNH